MYEFPKGGKVMYDEYIMLNTFKNHILDIKIAQPFPSHIKGIYMLNDPHSTLRSNYVYLCSPDFIDSAFSTCTFPEAPPVFVLTAGEHPDLSQYHGASIVSTDLDLVELYNIFQGRLWDMNSWVQRMHQVVYGSKNLQEILDIASEKIVGASILVFSNNYSLLAHIRSTECTSSYIDSIIRYGRQDDDTEGDFDNSSPFFLYEGRFLKEYNTKYTNNFCIELQPLYEGNIICRLRVVTDSPDLNHYYTALSCLLAENLEKFFRNNHDPSFGHSVEFSSFVSDLITMRLTKDEEIQKRKNEIHLNVNNLFRLVIIETENPSTLPVPTLYMTHSSLVENLQHIIPDSDITTYKGFVVILCRNSNPVFDSGQTEALTKLMTQYNYYMCIGGCSNTFQSLATYFYQAKSAIRISRKLDPSQRIINTEDYSVMEIIELSYQALAHYLNTHDLHYLCTSGFTTLWRYDEESGSNYVETVYTYLKNDRNTTESAKQLQIHRNTLIKKISRAEEVMCESLEDFSVRQRFILSYSIYEYSQKYLENNLGIFETQ